MEKISFILVRSSGETGQQGCCPGQREHIAAAANYEKTLTGNWDRLIVALVLFSAAVVLFFAEGGEIYGFNHDPNNPVVSLKHPKYEFTIVEEEIIPIDDGTEIKSVELWQLPPKNILATVITSPMAYIPPITASLITIFTSAIGLALLILFTKRSETNRDPDSRREQIYRWICQHPGKTQQQIAADLGISRSSLTYYLHQLEAAGSILSVRYGGQQHFLPANIGLNEHQKNLLPLLSKEKDHLFFQTLLSHPACTRQELSADLGISVTTVVWYIQRLKRSRMLTTTKQNRSSQYSLTPETVTAYQELVRIFPPQTDDRFPQDRDGKNR